MAEALFTISDAARAIGRSAWTIRRWEREGVIPPACRVGGKRRYSPDDIATMRKQTDPAMLEVTSTVNPPAAWQDLQPEPEEVQSWAVLSGQEEPTIVKLPTICLDCPRTLSWHASQRPSGQRILQAVCDRHGPVASIAWT